MGSSNVDLRIRDDPAAEQVQVGAKLVSWHLEWHKFWIGNQFMTNIASCYIGAEIELGYQVLEARSESPAFNVGQAPTAAYRGLSGDGCEESHPSLDEYDDDSHRVRLDSAHVETVSSLAASAFDLAPGQRILRAKIIRCQIPAEEEMAPKERGNGSEK